MSAKGQHHTASWDQTPFGCLTGTQRGRQPSLAEALAEVAARHPESRVL